jgi:hypothetical protein
MPFQKAREVAFSCFSSGGSVIAASISSARPRSPTAQRIGCAQAPSSCSVRPERRQWCLRSWGRLSRFSSHNHDPGVSDFLIRHFFKKKINPTFAVRLLKIKIFPASNALNCEGWVRNSQQTSSTGAPHGTPAFLFFQCWHYHSTFTFFSTGLRRNWNIFKVSV